MNEDSKRLARAEETRLPVLSPEQRVWNNISRLGIADKLMRLSGPNIDMQRAILSGAPNRIKAAAFYDSVIFVTGLSASSIGVYVIPKLIATQGPLKDRQPLDVSLYKIAGSEEEQESLARAIWGDITDEEKIQLATIGIQRLRKYEQDIVNDPHSEPYMVQDHQRLLEKATRIEEAIGKNDITISFDPQCAAARIIANSK